jgi:hypothetical protein
MLSQRIHVFTYSVSSRVLGGEEEEERRRRESKRNESK